MHLSCLMVRVRVPIYPAFLDKNVEDLELSVRSANCLKERQYSIYWPTGTEDRCRDAQDKEFWS